MIDDSTVDEPQFDQAWRTRLIWSPEELDAVGAPIDRQRLVKGIDAAPPESDRAAAPPPAPRPPVPDKAASPSPPPKPAADVTIDAARVDQGRARSADVSQAGLPPGLADAAKAARSASAPGQGASAAAAAPGESRPAAKSPSDLPRTIDLVAAERDATSFDRDADQARDLPSGIARAAADARDDKAREASPGAAPPAASPTGAGADAADPAASSVASPPAGVPIGLARAALAAREGEPAPAAAPFRSEIETIFEPAGAVAAGGSRHGPVLGVRLSGETMTFRVGRGQHTIGREQPVDVKIERTDVSRRHATITVGDEIVTLQDHDSANGTMVNDEPLKGYRRLRDGDRVAFAKATFVVTLIRQEDSAQ